MNKWEYNFYRKKGGFMSILTSILVALIAVNGSNISMNDLNIDKSHYFVDLEKAQKNQNDYCLSFIEDLERNNKIEDCSNITVLTHGLCSSYKDWFPLYKNNEVITLCLNDKIIGFVDWSQDENVIHINIMEIHPDYT